MSELQAIIDFEVELHKFINIDLFHRGFYQIRVTHRIVSKLPHKIELNILEDYSRKSKKSRRLSSISNIHFPALAINDQAVSKTFHILYKNEEVNLKDVFQFKDHILVNANNYLKTLSELEFYLDVELWFTEDNYDPDNQDSIKLMFKRQLKLHFDIRRGLHYFLPVTFDYFHLSTVTISVHACLVTICLPYLSKQSLNKNDKIELCASNNGLGYDYLFFECTFSEILDLISKNNKEVLDLIHCRAQLLHWQICSLLLASFQNISRQYNDHLKLLPPLTQCKFKKPKIFKYFQLSNLSKLAQECYKSCLENDLKNNNQDFFHSQNLNFAKEVFIDYDENQNNIIKDENIDKKMNENSINKKNYFKDLKNFSGLTVYEPEDYIAMIVSDIAYICGSLIMVWQNFMKLVLHNDKINHHLSKIHHLHRCKRFSEAFFVKEKSKDLIFTNENFETHYLSDVIENLKKSDYLNLLPKCQIECSSLDGDYMSLPIIFEEKFVFDDENIFIKNNDMYIQRYGVNDDDIINDEKKDLKKSTSDVSTKSSSTSSLSSNANTSSNNSNFNNDFNSASQNSSTLIEDKNIDEIFTKKENLVDLKPKLKKKLSLTKLNFNGFKQRRSSTNSIPISKKNSSLAENQSCTDTSSSTNSNNSSLLSYLTTKSLKPNYKDIDFLDLNSISKYKNLGKNLKPIDVSKELVGLSNYNNLKIDEREVEKNIESLNFYSMVETISLNNIKYIKLHKKKKLKIRISESLPDLSVKNLHKCIKNKKKNKGFKFSGKNIKKKSSPKNLKKNKSTDNFVKKKLSENSYLETISLNFSSNLKSMNKIILNSEEELDENSYSDIDNYIDTNEIQEDESFGFDSKNFVIENLVAKPEKSNENNESIDQIDCSLDNKKCTILDMLKMNACLACGLDDCDCVLDYDLTSISKQPLKITDELFSFVRAKENFRQAFLNKMTGWTIYSDLTNLASRMPYFQSDINKTFNTDGVHLVVCVHGLDGNCLDLRLIKTYLELGLPTTNFEFLMSQSNQGSTYDSFEEMTKRLCSEINNYIKNSSIQPSKISFIGHSLGNIIIRSVLNEPQLEYLLPKLHCFLSLSGPHLGTLYNTNGLVNMGLWLMQKWKKSVSLSQLCLKDNLDLHQTFLYKLSKNSKMHLFKYVLLCGSSQDHYVPRHSAHIQNCYQSLNDNSKTGKLYQEMINNILNPFLKENKHKSIEENGKDIFKFNEENCNLKFNCSELIRFDVWHSNGGGANALIGRAAHIAVLDSELFIEKFMSVVGLKYFA